jgi:SP family galactose:H+ symporter-like MFS transporter
MIWIVAAVAAIAGFLFGFDEGVIAGALAPLKQDFTISATAEGVMTAAVPLGALVGALAAGYLASPMGRRGVLLAAAVLFVLGALWAALAGDVFSLTMARLVLGLAIGSAAMTAPLYIAECAPAEKRGTLVAAYQLAITLGILGAYFIDDIVILLTPEDPSDSWRWMFAAGIVPAVALGVGMALLTDTPRWLMQKGRRDEARRVAAKLAEVPENDRAVAAELADIEARLAEERRGTGGPSLLSPTVRPALIVAMGLFLLQQLSGINAVIYFAPTVFGLTGFDTHAGAMLATVGIGVVNVAMTVVGMIIIDRIGRRSLLVIGFLGTAVSLAAIAVAASSGSGDLGWVALIGLVVYIAAFAISIGPLPWIMMAEVFPLSVRGPGMGLASVANWGFNALVVFSFPVLLQAVGLSVVFGLFAIVCALGVFFTLRYVPETRGASLEDIEAHLTAGRPFAAFGRA